jgi:flagellar motility protein MotE (MotC chaperone)
MTSRAVAVTLLAMGAMLSPAFAEQKATTNLPVRQSETAPVAKDFCSSFIDLAAEMRNARLANDLQQRREALAEVIQELDAKSQELKALITLRKSMQDKVSDAILKIFLQTEPEAAAQQLSRLDPPTAAEILVRMNAKRSGEILTLMEPKRAASLVTLLAAQTSQKKEDKP